MILELIRDAPSKRAWKYDFYFWLIQFYENSYLRKFVHVAQRVWKTRLTTKCVSTTNPKKYSNNISKYSKLTCLLFCNIGLVSPSYPWQWYRLITDSGHEISALNMALQAIHVNIFFWMSSSCEFRSWTGFPCTFCNVDEFSQRRVYLISTYSFHQGILIVILADKNTYLCTWNKKVNVLSNSNYF